MVDEIPETLSWMSRTCKHGCATRWLENA